MYAKLLFGAKKCLPWIVAVCVFLVCVTICVRSCQRHIECDINAARNRITIQLVSPAADGIAKKKHGKD